MARRTFSEVDSQLIAARDQWRCFRCGKRGGLTRQHRRPRAMGGSVRLHTNCICNGIMLCGDGTTGWYYSTDTGKFSANDSTLHAAL